jgi:hypothetical protein
VQGGARRGHRGPRVAVAAAVEPLRVLFLAWTPTFHALVCIVIVINGHVHGRISWKNMSVTR